jgi:hypothetical protein
MAEARGTALALYVRLLTKTLAWPPAGDLLLTLAQRTDLDAALAVDIQSALKKLGLAQPAAASKPIVKPEPGFADD